MIEKNVLVEVLQEQWENFEKKELGVEREKLGEIGEMVKTPQVVVITGLRRVGKSTLLAQIAKKYLNDDFYYVNFEDERLTQFGVEDFALLQETLVSIWGERNIWLLDEIQNISGWERFVRRMHDSSYKLFVTGSNASLLSAELATRLTGRSLRVELYPFSWREYLEWRGEQDKAKILTTREKGRRVRWLDDYLVRGGIAEALQYPKLEVLSTLYNDVLYRDIVSRYGLGNVASIKELAHYLASNVANLLSFNKLKELLKLGSVNTVKSYIEYLESSWLFLVVNKYAYSIKEQQIAAKKIYCIDTGLAQAVGFGFSSNRGKYLENLVYIELRRRGEEVYYYKTKDNREVDFYLPRSGQLIQVTEKMKEESTREREVESLKIAKEELRRVKKMIIVTEREKETIDNIEVMPIYEWLGGDRGKI